MCGLVGIASVNNITQEQKKAFSDLLIIDTLRGPHSTGVMSVNYSGSVSVDKGKMEGWTFVQTGVYDRAVNVPVTNRVLAGHNRWATKGAVNVDNAHPFTHGSVTMMHNGTLVSQSTLEKGNTFDTDSECIAYNLSIADVDEVPDVVEKINGAFALVWYDTRDNSLNFVRNSERELYTTWQGQDTSDICWASEFSMIELALSRRVSSDTYGPTGLLPELVHVKLRYSEDRKSFQRTDTQCKEYVPVKSAYVPAKGVIGEQQRPDYYPTVGEVVEIPFATFRHYQNGNLRGCVEGVALLMTPKGDFTYLEVTAHNVISSEVDVEGDSVFVKLTGYSLDGTKAFGTHVGEPTSLSQELLTDKELSDDDFMDDYQDNLMLEYMSDEDADSWVLGPDNALVSPVAFDKLTQYGCGYCSANVFKSDAPNITWEQDVPVCEECSSEVSGNCG